LSTFSGLSAALTALHASQRAMQVTANNIANVNTPGYTRQRASLTEIADFAHPGPHSQSQNIGDGVMVDKVERIQDAFLENRGRIEHAQKAYLDGQKQVLGRIEQAFGEPADTALQAQLNEFWNTFSDVANRPNDTAARTVLIARGTIVADGIRDMAGQLNSVWDTTKAQLGALVSEVNEAAKTVAQLNSAVVASHVNNQPANELADKRDLAIMKLTELTGATTAPRKDGSVDVLLGGSLLVSGNMSRELLEPSGAMTMAAVKGGQPIEVRWADGMHAKVTSSSGQLAASLEALNTTLPITYSRRLDDVAVNLATTVNAAHALGQVDDPDINGDPVRGGAVFGPPPGDVLTAANVRMLITNPSQLAMADYGAGLGAKDGTNADRMADLAKDADGPDRLYRQLVVDLGAQSQATQRRAEIQAATTVQADADRASQSGVNLDEEMSNLVQFERSYQAAAKVISTIDEMLDVLINRM
jgi:flagellar hook-associated protein 1 FlgK